MSAWDPSLHKASGREPKRWSSNEEIIAAWLDHMRRNNYSENVLTHYPLDVRVFARPWKATLLTQLEAEDVQQFVDMYATKCSRFMNGDKPSCRLGHSTVSCPMVTGAAREGCPSYRAMDPGGILSILRSVKAVYAWLVEEGHLRYNPADPVFKKYKRRHRAHFIKRARNPRRRALDVEEVRRLVKGSPIQHAIAYGLAAKCFLREHEVLKLRLDPAYCNLAEGWMELPPDRKFGDKRIGNNRIILDSEALTLLRQYLVWRDTHVKRDASGAEKTDRLILTYAGLEWGKGFGGNFRNALHLDCVRLGLMTGQETEREQRFNTHCFRAFATTWARDHRANDAEVQILRGDKGAGAIDRYDMYMARLPELYKQFGPVLGL